MKKQTARWAAWAGLGLAGAAAGAVWLQQQKRRRGYDLRERVVLITGGSRGLGYALAEEYLRRGSRVGIVARDAGQLEAAARRLASLGAVATFQADLARADEIASLVDRVHDQLGAIDVLVNNAGLIQVGPSHALEEGDFRDAMDLHFWAPLRLTRAVLPDMLRRRSGRIVNISSIGGVVAVPHLLSYSASKFALVGLSEGWHAELRRKGVRVTLVCPWLMRTGSQERALFRGDARREFAWFAASGATPLTAKSTASAARAIVDASLEGRPRVVLSLSGKLAALAHGVAPNTTIRILGWSAGLLPEATGPGRLRSGEESYNRWTGLLLRPWIRRAGQRWNQPAA